MRSPVTARTASAITSTIGILYAAVSVVFNPDSVSAFRDFGIGLAVAGVGWLVHGLCDAIDGRPSAKHIEHIARQGHYERAER